MWLVIGYGNPLRGDDGAGPRLAEQLATHVSAEQAKIIVAHQLTPELALELAAPGVRQVLFVDAQRQQESATLLSPIYPDATGSCGHQLSPQLLLQLSKQLYARPVPGWLLTIAGEQFSLSEQLSELSRVAVSRAFEQAIGLMSGSVADC